MIEVFRAFLPHLGQSPGSFFTERFMTAPGTVVDTSLVGEGFEIALLDGHIAPDIHPDPLLR